MLDDILKYNKVINHNNHLTLMTAEKVVDTDFFNDFSGLFYTDNFALNATTAGHVTA